ncbi:hypothetical protein NPJ88_007985 [Halomonas elongata]|uniref:hypothetical protein n=1 Tax=Halomonas elongata TaxID=2746 RepID=UPI00255AE4C6|nr:hypothetical protein [Halomonas elongata]MDL4862270.1 hypothetical protein [Halomonas elongata]
MTFNIHHGAALSGNGQAPHLEPANLATARLWQHQTMRRCDAIQDSIEHLVTERGLTESIAEDATLQAFAELEGINKHHRIDVDASTSRLLIIRTPAGERVALTITDLLALVAPTSLAEKGLTFQPVGRRLLVLDRAEH